MTTYIVLVNWTERGMAQVKDSPRRLDAAKKMLKEVGGDIKSVYLTMGEYDLVIVCEASDDAVAARFALQLGMLGNVRTRTLKAFPEAAYREIIASLGLAAGKYQYKLVSARCLVRVQQRARSVEALDLAA
jgi:uncharacterized protein with GYD domain